MIWRSALAMLALTFGALDPALAEDLPQAPNDGIYAVVVMPMVQDGRVIDANSVEVTRHLPLVHNPYLPMVLWVATAKSQSDQDIVLTGTNPEVSFILINPNLCEPFANAMPHYPVMSVDRYGAISPVDACLLQSSNAAVQTIFGRQRLTMAVAPQGDAFGIQADRVETGDAANNPQMDPNCTAFEGGCEGKAIRVRTFGQPGLRYAKIRGGGHFDAILTFQHDLPVYARENDPVPVAILPAQAPMIPVRSQKDAGHSDGNRWVALMVPPGMIDHGAADTISLAKIDFDGASVGRVDRVYARRMDLVEGRWVAQNARITGYDLRVSCRSYDDDDDRPSSTHGLAIFRTGSKDPDQLLLDWPGEANSAACADQVTVLDANFDGHPDLALFDQSGGAGPNNTSHYFLFDPQTEKFIYNAELSELPQLRFDAKRGRIFSEWRNGCCSHGRDVFKFSKGKLVKIRGKSW